MKNHCLPLLFAKRKIRREHRTSDFRYFLIPAKKPDRFSPLPIIPLCHPHFREVTFCRSSFFTPVSESFRSSSGSVSAGLHALPN